MARKLHHTLGDYVTMGLSPALIITLITSLTFFLTEILCGGQPHLYRLRWTLFWFTFGIVWVARIALHPAVGARARLYGILLTLAVWVGLQRFLVMDQLEGLESGVFRAFDWVLLLGFFAITWWSAYRLTWDCTFIDDTVAASGKGVLEAAGFDADTSSKRERVSGESPSHTSGQDAAVGWLERWRLYREDQRRKPHTPGVWVVYYSLAALPLFGLGQALLPVEAVERRRFAFWMLGLYTLSGLGLLLTTCYLGLRRSLRQRKLAMPLAMTGMWLALGGGLIVTMLAVAALLPRPQMEYSPFRRIPTKSSDLQASHHAILSGDPGKGAGKPGTVAPSDDPRAPANPNVQTQKKASGAGKSNGGGKDDKQGAGATETKSTAAEAGQGQTSAGQQNSPKGEKAARPGSSEEANTQPKSGGEEGSFLAENRPGSSSNPLEQVASRLAGLANVMKWLVFGVLVVVVVVLLLRSGLHWLANFTDWARHLLESWRAWWDSLFGRHAEPGEPVSVRAEVHKPRRPFATFANPFDGAAPLVPEEIVRYTFAALDAWADEHGWGRRPEETPREFAARLGEEVPALEEDMARFADLYAAAVYARATLTPACLPAVRKLWRLLEGRREGVRA